MNDKLFRTQKELAAALDSSPRYVSDMKRGGFRLPCTLREAIDFIRAKGAVSRFRKQKVRKSPA